MMHRTMFPSRAGFLVLLLGAASCRMPGPAVADEAPTGSPDLTGLVVEARVVRTLGGTRVTFGRLDGGSGADYIQRLQVRVIGSRSLTPIADAIVGVDGATALVRADSAHADRNLELPGAYVRVWFRGTPSNDSPARLSGMARRVIVDSVATRGASK